MTSEFMAAWARAFLMTQMIEVPIYRYGLHASFVVSFAASSITHPIVWFFFFGPLGWGAESSYEAQLVLAESFAVLVEGGWLALTRPRLSALTYALIANLTSFGLSAATRAVLAFP